MLSEGFCGDDLVHKNTVTLSNSADKEEFVTERNILTKVRAMACSLCLVLVSPFGKVSRHSQYLESCDWEGLILSPR